MILELKKIKSVIVSTFLTPFCHGVIGTGCPHLSFVNVESHIRFLLSSFTLIKRLFSPSSLSVIKVCIYTNT